MGRITTLQTSPNTNVERILNASDKKTYFVYNVSTGFDNYSQRNSKYEYVYKNYKTNWASFCNVHMMAMGLIYTGTYNRFKKEIDSKYPELSRLPDKLAKFILEDEGVRDYYKRRFPTISKDFFAGNRNAYGPNEIHNVLSYGTNKFLDIGTVTYFSTYTSWKEIIYELVYKKCPVGISGKFSGLNHIVLLVGCAYANLEGGTVPGPNQVPDYLIIDDPYGKTYEYNKGLSGNDIWIPFSKCVEDFKALECSGFKFTHRFIKPDQLGL
jgi:hypothetical protein